MTYLWRGVAAVLGIIVLAGGAIYLASELGGEVAVLTTRDAADVPHTTRIWVVDDAGSAWLRAGQPGSGWLRRLETEPLVELERGGRARSFRAVPVRDAAARDKIHRLMAAKYGWADRVIGWTRDSRNSIAVRLDPVEASTVP